MQYSSFGLFTKSKNQLINRYKLKSLTYNFFGLDLDSMGDRLYTHINKPYYKHGCHLSLLNARPEFRQVYFGL